MTEKPTFCPVCKRMQVGVHGKDHATEDFGPARVKATHNPEKDFTYVGPVGIFPPPKLPSHDPEKPRIEVAREAQAKFDKTAYQRDYMKRWRAKQKAKP